MLPSRNLESRLEDISARLESSSRQAASVDPDIIRNLESQVSELSRHLAKPGVALPEFEDIGPRLDDIERSLAGNRNSILEAARQAAESAVRSFAGSKSDAAAVSALADDLRSLDDLARRSDERNTKTFEAIHDTLLKIVDRLGSLEDRRQAAFAELALPAEPARKMALRDAPSIEPGDDMRMAPDMPVPPQPSANRDVAAVTRSPAEAAAEAAEAALDTDKATEPAARSRSMFGGLSRAFSRKKQRAEPAMAQEPSLPGMEAQEPTLDLDQPLDPKLANRPLEPGSGTPDLNAIMRRVRDERAQPAKSSEADAANSDFIAAARRAAQAAAAEAEIMKRHPDLAGPVRNMKLGNLFSSKRKPLLMAGVAILVVVGRAAARQGLPHRRCRHHRRPAGAGPECRAGRGPGQRTAGGSDHRPGRGSAAERNRTRRRDGRRACNRSAGYRSGAGNDGARRQRRRYRRGRNGRGAERRCTGHDRFDAAAGAGPCAAERRNPARGHRIGDARARDA